MEKFITGLIAVLGIFALVLIIDLIFAWPFMLLWNWLMPTIFSIKTITFWQAYGLMLLCSFLFKSSNTSTKN